MKRYFNIRTNYGVETIDQLFRSDFNSDKEYRAEIVRLKKEYRFAGMNVYTSQRCDKTWNA